MTWKLHCETQKTRMHLRHRNIFPAIFRCNIVNNCLSGVWGHLEALLVTGRDVELLVDLTGVAVFTENFCPGRQVPGGHHGHDGPEDGVDGEQTVLGVEPEAVVGLVAQAHPEPRHGTQLRGNVHTQIVPH